MYTVYIYIYIIRVYIYIYTYSQYNNYAIKDGCVTQTIKADRLLSMDFDEALDKILEVPSIKRVGCQVSLVGNL